MALRAPHRFILPLSALLVSCGDGLGGFLISDAQEVEMGAGVDTQIRGEYRLAAANDPATQWLVQFIGPLVELGERKKAEEIMDVMSARAIKALGYYTNHDPRQLFDTEQQMNLIILQNLMMAAQQIGDQKRAQQYQQLFAQYYPAMGG